MPLASPSQDEHAGQPLDSVLVAAARAGDGHAMHALLECYYPPMLRFLTRLTRDPSVAEDLAQEVMLAASRGLPTLTASDSFAPWLYRIARNTFYSAARGHRFQRAVSLDWLAAKPQASSALIDPAHGVGKYEERELIEQALARMSPDARGILHLRHVEELPSKDIAEVLDITPAAARQRIHRAEEEFRRQFEALERAPGARRVRIPHA